MKTLYQLVAHGRLLCFTEKSKISSKKVFTTREAAERHIETFKALCCAGQLYDLNPEETTVKVVELELQEEESDGH